MEDAALLGKAREQAFSIHDSHPKTDECRAKLLCSHENFKTKTKAADSTKYTDSCQLVLLSGYHSLHSGVKLQPVPNSRQLKGHTEKYLPPRQKLLFAIHPQ